MDRRMETSRRPYHPLKSLQVHQKLPKAPTEGKANSNESLGQVNDRNQLIMSKQVSENMTSFVHEDFVFAAQWFPCQDMKFSLARP